MCLLIASPKSIPVSLRVCRNATRGNPDGFGIAFPNMRKNKVAVCKWEKIKPESQYKIIQKITERNIPYIAHWRYATSGKVCERLSHPFSISKTCAFAHNGVMQIVPYENESDTSTLANYLKQKNIKTAKEFVYNIIQEELADGINKFAAIDSTGEIEIIGENFGVWTDGVWHSNRSGFIDTNKIFCFPHFETWKLRD